jgi:hypothetical protein
MTPDDLAELIEHLTQQCTDLHAQLRARVQRLSGTSPSSPAEGEAFAEALALCFGVHRVFRSAGVLLVEFRNGSSGLHPPPDVWVNVLDMLSAATDANRLAREAVELLRDRAVH